MVLQKALFQAASMRSRVGFSMTVATQPSGRTIKDDGRFEVPAFRRNRNGDVRKRGSEISDDHERRFAVAPSR